MLKQRVVTAVVALAALALILFVVPALFAELVIALAVLSAAWEWSAFLKMPTTLLRIVYVVVVAGVMAVVGKLWPDSAEFVLQVALVWWFLALIWTFFFPTPIPSAIRWLCGLLVLVPLYVALVKLYQANPSSLLSVLLIVWAADIGAFFVGKRFGRVKLAPKISPGKTWEGVIGGLALVVLLILGHSFWFESDLTVLIPFCVGIAGISIIGDLTVSMFKRTAGLKDSGSLFPGHGGVLDRVDSLASAAPAFVLGLAVTGLA